MDGYIEIFCQTCHTLIMFTPAEIVELRSNHGLAEHDEIQILNCPNCSQHVCAQCTHSGHA